MNRLLDSAQPPIFREVITKALKTIEKTRKDASVISILEAISSHVQAGFAIRKTSFDAGLFLTRGGSFTITVYDLARGSLLPQGV